MVLWKRNIYEMCDLRVEKKKNTKILGIPLTAKCNYVTGKSCCFQLCSLTKTAHKILRRGLFRFFFFFVNRRASRRSKTDATFDENGRLLQYAHRLTAPPWNKAAFQRPLSITAILRGQYIDV